MRRRRALVVVPAVGALLSLSVDLVVNSASTQTRWPGWLEFVRLNPWPSLAVLIGIMAGLAVLSVKLPAADPPVVELAAVADSFAVAVRSQWDDEAKWRKLHDPYPLLVRWGPADADLFASWSALTRLATTGPGWPVATPGRWAAGLDELAGGGNDITDVLWRIPTGRLVVLGEPGAGKTVLLIRMVLDLLARRSPGEEVPVLLPLTSRDPVDEGLFDWMERWLITNYVALADPAPNLPTATRARALLNAGLILPVLDGLDEIPDTIRGPAITRINDAMRPGRRLVLAARTKEYRAAVHPPDGAEINVTGAAGICLFPLDATVVANYLKDSAGGPTGAARWAPVIATLADDDRSPAAQALTTPLVAALARANYNPRPDESVTAIQGQPTELLDRKRFPCHESIRLYLFDRFIPAAYREHPDPSRRNRWTAAQAQQWLTYLAHDLEQRQNGTTDFAWWELRGAAPRSFSVLAVGSVAGLAAALGFSLPIGKGMPIGLGVGFITACLTGFLARRWIQIGREGIMSGAAGGLFGGQLGALAVLAVFGLDADGTYAFSFVPAGLAFGLATVPLGKAIGSLVGAFIGVISAALMTQAFFSQMVDGSHGPARPLINGIGFGLAVGMAVSLTNQRLPARGMRWSPLGLIYGLIAGLVFGGATWIHVGPEIGLLVGIVVVTTGGGVGAFAFEVAAADPAKATTPTAVLVRDRGAFRSAALSLGVAVGLSSGLALGLAPSADGSPNGWQLGIGVGVANLIGVGLAAGFLRASWGSYTLARLWLAGSGHLPWRLMAFLADAHINRGVLRQAGAVYQFRHVELQRRLAVD